MSRGTSVRSLLLMPFWNPVPKDVVWAKENIRIAHFIAALEIEFTPKRTSDYLLGITRFGEC